MATEGECAISSNDTTVKWYHPGRRHGQSLLMFWALLLCYALKTSMSVGVVAMTSKSSNNNEVLDWTGSQKGLVLSSFFWGYIVLQLPAGIIAKAFGPTRPLGLSFISAGTVTCFIPLAAIKGGWKAVIVIRVITGLLQSTVYPSIYAHMVKWAVPSERSKLFSFAMSGMDFGILTALWLGGWMAGSSLGWPSIFYFVGGGCILWGILDFFFGADSPDEHKTISEKERAFINDGLKDNKTNEKVLKTPWKEMLLSQPYWVLNFTGTCDLWCMMTLLTYIPSYIHGVLGIEIASNGFLSGVPYLSKWIANIIFSTLSDYLLEKKFLTRIQSMRTWNSIAEYGGALFLILVAFLPPTRTTAILCLTFAVSLSCGTYYGHMSNLLDLSPNFAGPLMGVSNVVGGIASIFGPLICGYIVSDDTDATQWRIVFLVGAGTFVVGNTVFLFFSSAETQPWNNPKEDESPEDSTETRILHLE